MLANRGSVNGQLSLVVAVFQLGDFFFSLSLLALQAFLGLMIPAAAAAYHCLERLSTRTSSGCKTQNRVVIILKSSPTSKDYISFNIDGKRYLKMWLLKFS